MHDLVITRHGIHELFHADWHLASRCRSNCRHQRFPNFRSAPALAGKLACPNPVQAGHKHSGRHTQRGNARNPCPQIIQTIDAVTRPCRTQDLRRQLSRCGICAIRHMQTDRDHARTIVPASASATAGGTSGRQCDQVIIDYARSIVTMICAFKTIDAMTRTRTWDRVLQRRFGRHMVLATNIRMKRRSHRTGGGTTVAIAWMSVGLPTWTEASCSGLTGSM